MRCMIEVKHTKEHTISWYVGMFFIKKGDLDKTIELVKTMIKKKIQFDLCTYTIVLDEMCKVERLKNVQEVFQNLLIKGYHPNVYTYTIMITL